MRDKDAEELLIALYEIALNRAPSEIELNRWISALATETRTLTDLMKVVKNSEEFSKKRAVRSQFPAGHFHSPVVNPATVSRYFDREVNRAPSEILGIDLSVGEMRDLWLKNLEFVQSTPFEDKPNPKNRYSYMGGPFPFGDGIALRMMIGHYRPRRIVEIGSGFSSACMLDSADHLGLKDFHLTCIDPNTARLKSLLRESDSDRITIVDDYIQNVSPSVVDQLEKNDILFIDSTHVMKTGSDVHFEFFYLLPRLKPGVVIHVHDIMYPFEYPRKWVLEDNYSWNEAYLLRAFLMYNDRFKITFWNSLYAKQHRKDITEEFPTFLRNPGGSIWLERVLPAVG
jgi:predicted O-methyltransferase YrrM